MGRRSRGLAGACSTALCLAALTLGIGVSTLACGGDRDERGLAFPGEDSTPESAAEMGMTEDQRREKAMLEEAAKERQEFNEGGERLQD